MSGYTDDVIANHHLKQEGVHFIEKPFTPDSLAAKLHEIMRALQTRLQILLVDDDYAVCNSLREFLQHAGHTVFPSANGIEAVKLLKQLDVDVVITDVVMPYKDGIDLIVEIRREWPHIKTIAMSGNVSALDRAAEQLQDVYIIQKPLNSGDLLEFLQGIAITRGPLVAQTIR